MPSECCWHTFFKSVSSRWIQWGEDFEQKSSLFEVNRHALRAETGMYCSILHRNYSSSASRVTQESRTKDLAKHSMPTKKILSGFLYILPISGFFLYSFLKYCIVIRTIWIQKELNSWQKTPSVRHSASYFFRMGILYWLSNISPDRYLKEQILKLWGS